MANDFPGSASPWPEPDFSDPWGKAPKLPDPWDRVTSAAEWDDVPIPRDVPDKANPFIVANAPRQGVGVQVTANGAPPAHRFGPRDPRERARLKADLEIQEGEYFQSSIIGPLYGVSLYCGHCMTGPESKRRPVKAEIGALSYFAGGTWLFSLPYVWIGEMQSTDWIQCPLCKHAWHVDTKRDAQALTEFFLLRKERRRRQSLDHLVKIGLAKEPPF